MLDLSDLGLEPVHSASTDVTPTVVTSEPASRGIVPGSVMARTLYAAFARQPVTIIDSPPGAGKSTLIVEVVETLLRRSALTLVVACPTRRGAHDLASRLVEAIGTGPDAAKVVFSVKGSERPEGTVTGASGAKRSVAVRTVSSCTYSAPDCDLMIFDEAYQTTFADVMAAADGADQVIMVGDPGQIGPVVTQDTSAWQRMRSAPHKRAPEVFAARDDATVLQLDATYRLGAQTVEAIAPLYGFPFVSKRPDRRVVDRAGTVLPELAHRQIAPATGIGCIETMKQIADLAASMVGREVVSHDEDGNEVRERLREKDVAVVVSHNVQASGIQAILRSLAYEGITVGTADRMQGGQWHVVVALDPLVGHATVSPHQLNPGRLCVMASRHQSAMVWVSDGEWEPKLRASVEDAPADAKVGIAVRRALTATAI